MKLYRKVFSQTFKIVLFLSILISVADSLHSQNANITRANQSFERLAYAEAIPYYLKALKKSSDPEATIKLAECYRLTNQYEPACEWYRKVMALPGKPSSSVFYYAHTLLMNGDFAAAKNYFLEFSKMEPKDPRGKKFADAIDQIKSMAADSGRCQIKNLNINSPASDFSAWNYSDGIIFASSRKGSTAFSSDFKWLNEPFLDLYYSKGTDPNASYSEPEKMTGDINTKFHESNFSKPKEGNTVYFNRNNFTEGKKGTSEENIILLKIYSGEFENGEVKNIREFTYNNSEYSVCHPSVSPDGKLLFFSSDKPGGKGGKDIYYCRKEGNGWGVPINPGPSINTPGDEVFPFIYKDGTLYFSSNGHPGLGHLDIFSARSNGKDTVVTNMGGGINSAYDDFAFFLNDDSKTGFISSNRKGGKGNDDIWSFTLSGASVEIIVMDKVAQLPIENARIHVDDKGNGQDFDLVTDSAGRVFFLTELGKKFDGLVKTIEFDPHELDMNTNSKNGETHFKYIVELYNPPPAISAIVIDDETKERLPGSIIKMVYLPTKDTLVRVADKNGRFAIKLGKEATYQMIVNHEGYLNYTDIVSTTDISYDGDTIIPLKMQKIHFNKPIVLENIHYDFDKWFIRQDAIPDLMKLTKLMQDNPQLVVELSSHTDSRGSNEYNIVLSQKRATSARTFLVQQGVEPRRIIAKGYGETKLVNECADGIECDENRHFANRRTEFSIIGTIDGIDVSHSILATTENPNDPPVYIPESSDAWPTQETDFNEPVLPSQSHTKTTSSGVYFCIQLGTSDAAFPDDKLKLLFEYKSYYFKGNDNGKALNLIGEFKTYKEALQAQNHLRSYGFKEGFVTAWRGSKKLSATEMAPLMN